MHSSNVRQDVVRASMLSTCEKCTTLLAVFSSAAGLKAGRVTMKATEEHRMATLSPPSAFLLFGGLVFQTSVLRQLSICRPAWSGHRK